MCFFLFLPFPHRAELGEWVRAQELCTYSLLFSEAAGLSLSMGRCYCVKFRLALTEGKMDVALQFAQLACRQSRPCCCPDAADRQAIQTACCARSVAE